MRGRLIWSATVVVLLWFNNAIVTHSQISIPATQPSMVGNPNITHAQMFNYSCGSTGDPWPTIEWTLGTESVLNAIRVVENNYVNSTLRIMANVEDDGKNLTCIVKQAGVSSLILLDYKTLYIAYVPVVNVLRNQYMIETGTQFSLTGTVAANPPLADLYWRKISPGSFDIRNNSNINRYSVTNNVNQAVYTTTLAISNSISSDAGNYVAYATPVRGSTGTSVTIALFVITFALSSTQNNGIVGGSITLNCDINGRSGMTHNIIWYQNSKLITRTSRYINGDSNTPSLTITGLTTADGGTYNCQITSGQDTLTSPSITLTVSESAPQVVASQTTYIANTNDVNLRLNCTVTNMLPSALSRVFWTKQQSGQTISPGTAGYSGMTTSDPSLIINSVVWGQAGRYICSVVSSTQVEGRSPEIDLALIDVPTTRYDTTAGENVTLTCNINSPLQSYSVSWYRNSVLLSTVFSPSKYQGGSSFIPSLTILSLTSADQGTYYCQIRLNSNGLTHQGRLISLFVTERVAPTVFVSQTTYISNVGETNVRLTCGISNQQSVSVSYVYWTLSRSNQLTTNITSTSLGYNGISTSDPSIIINGVSFNDAGTYVCYAVSVDGLVGQSQAVYLTVIQIPTSQYSINEGQDVVLACNVNSPVTYSLFWYKDNNLLSTTNTNKYQNGNSGNPSLTIRTLSTSDAGQYYCRASRSQVAKSSSIINLNVIPRVAPTVFVSQTTYISNVGETNVRLTCGISNQQSVSVSYVYWTLSRSNQLTTNITSTSVRYNGITTSDPSVTINAMSFNDAGTYVCYAVSVDGLVGQSQAVYLTVIQIPTSQYSINEGQDVVLVCNVNSPVTYSLFWYKDNNLLSTTNTNKYQNGNSGIPSLTIRTLSTSDAGQYYCRASRSQVAKSSSIINLNVIPRVAPTVFVSQTTYISNVGETNVRLTCGISNQQSVSVSYVYWTLSRSNQLTTNITSTSLGYNGISTSDPSIIINGVSYNDAGTYVCYAVSVDGLVGQSQAVYLTVIQIPTSQYSINEGQDVVLVCNVNSPVTYSLFWYKDNNLLSTTNTNKYQNGNSGIPSLTIRTLSTSDAGQYYCRASRSQVAKSSSIINLNVIPRVAPTVFVSQTTYISNVGETNVRLTCGISNQQSVSVSYVYWTLSRSNQLTTNITSTSVRYNGITTSDPSVTINAISFNDAGTYVCYAVSVDGLVGQSQAVYLTAIQIPTSQYSINEGQDVVLVCNVNSPVTYSLFWYKDNNLLSTTNTNKYQNGNSGNPSLTIRTLSTSDAGQYYCRASRSQVAKSSSIINLNVIPRVAPTVFVSQTTYISNVGETNVRLTCGISNQQSVSVSYVYWTLSRSNQLTTNITSTSVRYNGITTSDPSVTINAISFNDAGTYVCYAVSVDGLVGQSQAVYLTVIQIPTSQYSINEGQDVVLVCNVNSPVTYSLFWYKDNNLLSTTNTNKYQNGNSGIPSLTIRTLSTSDAGQYYCRASRSQVAKSSSIINLNVIPRVAPTVFVSQTTYISNVGETNVRLTCGISNQQSVSVSYVYWTLSRSNQLTTNITSTSLGYNGISTSDPSIIINGVSYNDAGTYICYAVSVDGLVGQSQAVYLTVIQIPTSQYSINEGQDVVLVCNVNSPVTYSLFWYKDNNLLTTTNTNKYQNGNSGNPSLTIRTLSTSDAGQYYCRASRSQVAKSSSIINLNVIPRVAPTVFVSQTTYISNVGETNVRLTCGISNQQSVSVSYVYWTLSRSNQLTTNITSTSLGYNGISTSDPSIIINGVSYNDAGTYVCYAVSVDGLVGQSHAVYLTVIQIPTSQYSINEGQDVVLVCNVNSPVTYSLFWYKDNNLLTTTNTNKYQNGNSGNPSLTIRTLSTSDAGQYYCRASRSQVAKSSSIINLNVIPRVAPTVFVSQTTYISNVGETNVRLTCGISNQQSVSVSYVYWTLSRSNQLTTNITSTSLGYNGISTSDPSIIINGVSYNDAGTYVCYAVSVDGLVGQSQAVYLTVIQIPTSQYSINEGQDVVLVCNVNSPVTYSLFWYKDNNLLTTTNTNKYQNGNSGNPSLTIRTLSTSDAGQYYCRASRSQVAKSSSIINLNVIPRVAPIVFVSQTTYISNVGETNVRLTCGISNQQSVSVSYVYWTLSRSNQLTTNITSTSLGYNGISTSDPSIIINGVSYNDAGTYVCYAVSVDGLVGQSQAVYLTAIQIPTSQYSINEGQDVVLVCNVNSPVTYSLFWYKDNNLLTTTNTNKYQNGNSGNPSLTIRTLSTSDAGQYYCRASRSQVAKSSSIINLNVIPRVAPTVFVSQTTYISNVGETNVRLTCGISNQQSVSVSYVYWTLSRSNQLTTNITSTSLGYNGISTSDPSIIINGVSYNDAGTYVCYAVSVDGLVGQSQAVYLTVIQIPTSQYSINEGQDVVLVCNVNSPVTYSLFWYKDNNLLTTTNTNKYQNGNSGNPSLTIRTLSTSDAGQYYCRASRSQVAKSSSIINLNVIPRVAPTVFVSQTTYISNVGETNVRLTCGISNQQSVSVSYVYWTLSRSNQLTTNITSTSLGYNGITTSDPSVTINAISFNDAGTYICYAVSVDGLVGQSQAVNLTVIDVPTTRYDTTAGENVTLTCNINSPLRSYSVSWYRNSVLLIAALSPSNYEGGPNFNSLTIKSLTLADQGTYYCQIRLNSTGLTNQGRLISLFVTERVAPTVFVSQTTYISNVGETNVRLTCGISNQQSVSVSYVYWTLSRSNQLTTNITSTSLGYNGISTSDPSIIINVVSFNDAGTYICYAVSVDGLVGQSQAVYLTVIQIPTSQYSINEGQDVVLACNVNSPVTYSLFWYKDNNLLSTTNTNKYQNGNSGNPSLTIRTLSTSDAGQYYCRASRSQVAKSSSIINLNVIPRVAPTVFVSQTTYISNVGETNVRLTCGISNQQSVSVSYVYWTLSRSNQLTTNITSTSLGYNGISTSDPSIIINGVSYNDAGTYVCYAVSIDGLVGQSQAVYLTVIQIPTPQYSINEGQDVVLVCNVNSPVTYSLFWYKDNNLLSTNTNKYLNGNSGNPSLTIRTISTSDAGQYYCRASRSQVAKSSSVISLNVIRRVVPTVFVSQTTYISNIGETNVGLTCGISNQQSVSISYVYWSVTRVNQQSTNITTTSFEYSGITTSNPSIIINRIAYNHAGTYVCNAVSVDGLVGRSQAVYLTVIQTPQLQYRVNAGDDATLVCNVNSPVSISLAWYKDNNILSTTNTNKYQNGNSGNPSLTIKSVSSNDEGPYYCRVSSNQVTKSSSLINLVVSAVVTAFPTSYTPAQGSNVTLSCSISVASYTVNWYKDGQRILLNSGKYGGGIFLSPSLRIYNVNTQDNGVYICSAVSGGIITNSSSVFVSVQFGPVAPDSMTFTPSNITVRVGERIQVLADAGGSPIPVYSWSKDNVIVSTGHVLLIQSAKLSHDGIYTVTASNAAGEATGRVRVTVIDTGVTLGPRNITILPSSLTLLRGSRISARCNAIGNFLSYSWTKEGTKISDGAVLEIPNSRKTDRGRYICTASNSGGQLSAVLDVNVEYAPEITTSVQRLEAIKGSSVTLFCKNDANPPASSYTWVYNGITRSTTTPSFTITTDSSSSVDYQCTATNKHGTSSPHVFNVFQRGPFVTETPQLQQGFPLGAIIGISLGTIFLLLLLILFCCYLCRKGFCESCFVEEEKNVDGLIFPANGTTRSYLQPLDLNDLYREESLKLKYGYPRK